MLPQIYKHVNEIRALQQLSAACASHLVYVTMFILSVKLMDSMQPSTAWSVNHCPASQQITCILLSPISLPLTKHLATCLLPDSDQSDTRPIIPVH